MIQSAKFTLVAMLSMIVLGTVQAGAVVWEQEYNADVLPGAAGWTLSSLDKFVTDPSVSGGILTLDTLPATGSPVAFSGFMLEDNTWDGDTLTGSTIETRFRMTSGGTLRFQVGKTNWFHDLLFSPTRISSPEIAGDSDAAGGAGVDLDMTQFHTIRIVMGAGTASGARSVDVYIDGSTTSAFSVLGNNVTVNRLLVADGGSGAFGGVVEFDYIRWTNSEATPPIPEPASLGLIGIGVFMLLSNRRGRHSPKFRSND